MNKKAKRPKISLVKRIKTSVSKHKTPLVGGVLVLMFAFGLYLIVSGYIQYANANKESYIVAGVKSMQEGNFHKAQTYFMQAGKNGASEAYPYLAWISAKSGNFSKALEYARECAKSDDTHGEYELMGYLALLGYGNAQGAGSAIYFFNEALKDYSEDYLKTHDPMLKMCEYGIELCMNTQDYIRMVDEASNHGSKEALLYRGDIDFLGEENDVSPVSAAKSWGKAQRLGILSAQSRLAGLYWHGYGVQRDFEKALSLYNEAAKKGDPVANYSLGLVDFRRNSGLYGEGLRHMKNAAKKNYGPALTAVGVLALSQDRNNQKIIYATADIFKQAYDCGDSTGGILYSLMLMNGEGVAKDETTAFSILYDLKNRSVTSVNSLLRYFTYTKKVDTRKLFDQALMICRGIYLGEVTFSEGAPEASKYLEAKNDKTLSYYKSQKDDKERFDPAYLQSLGSNFVETLDKSDDITISGEPLLYPELYKILEMYNPTTGARPFMPQMIMKIDAALPKLPEYYDRFNLNLDGIENKL